MAHECQQAAKAAWSDNRAESRERHREEGKVTLSTCS